MLFGLSDAGADTAPAEEEDSAPDRRARRYDSDGTMAVDVPPAVRGLRRLRSRALLAAQKEEEGRMAVGDRVDGGEGPGSALLRAARGDHPPLARRYTDASGFYASAGAVPSAATATSATSGTTGDFGAPIPIAGPSGTASSVGSDGASAGMRRGDQRYRGSPQLSVASGGSVTGSTDRDDDRPPRGVGFLRRADGSDGGDGLLFGEARSASMASRRSSHGFWSAPNLRMLAARGSADELRKLALSDAKGALWEVEKGGFVEKKGFYWFKSWTPRFLLLKGRMLHYYEADKIKEEMKSVAVKDRKRRKQVARRRRRAGSGSSTGRSPMMSPMMSPAMSPSSAGKVGDVSPDALTLSPLLVDAAGSGSPHMARVLSGASLDQLALPPRGSLELCKDTVVHEDSRTDGHDNCFSVEPPEGPAWHVKCTNETEMRDWVQSIRQCLEMVKRAEGRRGLLPGEGDVHDVYDMGEVECRFDFGVVRSAKHRISGNGAHVVSFHRARFRAVESEQQAFLKVVAGAAKKGQALAPPEAKSPTPASKLSSGEFMTPVRQQVTALKKASKFGAATITYCTGTYRDDASTYMAFSPSTTAATSCNVLEHFQAWHKIAHAAIGRPLEEASPVFLIGSIAHPSGSPAAPVAASAAGATLADRGLKGGGALDVVKTIVKLSHALALLHGKRVVHRNVCTSALRVAKVEGGDARALVQFCWLEAADAAPRLSLNSHFEWCIKHLLSLQQDDGVLPAVEDVYCVRDQLSGRADVLETFFADRLGSMATAAGFACSDEEGIGGLLELIARDIDEPAEHSCTARLGCVAPEVAQCGYFGTAADVWSLGVVMYTLLARRRPARLASSADDAWDELCSATFPIDDGIAPSGSAIRSLLDAMLASDPAARPHARDIARGQWVELVQRELSGEPSSAGATRLPES